jgi:putative heme-binding domain-containing protein
VIVALLLMLAQQPSDESISVGKSAADNSIEAERAALKLADGLEINCFASEREGIVKPIAIRWDPRGRLWVLCTQAYPQLKPAERPDDRIFILEDRDGDGRADRVDLFADGLEMATGLEPGDGGVYVGQGTDLLHLRDTNGDGVADERRVVLTGFGTGDTHQNINSFVWSPGGELFFGQGLHAFAWVETPWGIEHLEEAGIWRLDPRRLRLDPFLGGSIGPYNPWGVVFDDWGQPFIQCGASAGIYHLTGSMISTDAELEFPPIGTRGRKLCGMDIVGGPQVPAGLRGAIVSGGFMNTALYAFRLEEQGSGFVARELPPLVLSAHKSFRPVDVRQGPDGAIYVADWFNPIVGHYQASFRHPERDKAHGRIWRIIARGATPARPPKLESLSVADLVAQLASPDRWTRYQVKRLLAERDGPAVARALEAWMPSATEHGRFEAIGVLESLQIVDGAMLERLARSREPRARAYAARVVGRWNDRLADAPARLASLARDEHPRVRLEALVSASRFKDPRALVAAAAVLDRPMDPFLDYALTQTVQALKRRWWPAFESGALAFEKPEHLAAVLRAGGGEEGARHVRALVESGQVGATVRRDLLAVLADTGTADDLRFVLDNGNDAALLAALAQAERLRRMRPSGDLVEPIRRRAAHPALRAEALRLAGLWELRPLAPEVRGAANDRAAPDAVREAAIESVALLEGVTALEAIVALASADEPPAMRRAAVAAAARLDKNRGAEAAVRLLGGARTEEEAQALMAPVLGRTGGAEALAGAIGRLGLSKEAAARAASVLNALGRSDAALMARLNEIAGLTVGIPDYSRALVDAIVAEARGQGDAARGRKVYESAQCMACHAIRGEGKTIGPELGAVGSALPDDLIVESILWPRRQVKEGFLSTSVVTKDGRVLSGQVQREDRELLWLRELGAEAATPIRKDEIARRQDGGTAMPDGLVARLSREEVRDLVRYLSEQRSAEAPPKE